MFSLIITIIAIALVAALALATLYYGGPVFNEGSERALAAKLDAQGQQIMGALELYNAELGHYPATLSDLVSTNYLKSIPTAAAEQAVMAAAYAATGTWSLSSPGQPVIVMKPVSVATCQAFNKANLGVPGVLQQAHSTKLKQCIGTDVNNLMIVQPKAASDLIFVSTDPAAVVQIGTVLATPVPAASDTSSNGWLTISAPTAPVTSVAYLDSGMQSVSSVAFESTAVGQTSATQVVQVRNTGTADISFTATPVSVSAPFSVLESTCASAVVTPGSSCAVSVRFTPDAAQSYEGASYKLTLNLVGSIVQNLLLTGVGVTPTVTPALTLMYLKPKTTTHVWAYVNLTSSPVVLSGLSVTHPDAYLKSSSHGSVFFEADGTVIVEPNGWVSTGWQDDSQFTSGLNLMASDGTTSYGPVAYSPPAITYCLDPDSSTWVSGEGRNIGLYDFSNYCQIK